MNQSSHRPGVTQTLPFGMDRMWIKLLSVSGSMNAFVLLHLISSHLIEYSYLRRRRRYTGAQGDITGTISGRRRSIISKLLTDSLAIIILACTAAVTSWGTNVIESSFIPARNIPMAWRDVVLISVGTNIGRYVYLVALSISHRNYDTQFKLSMVHHGVTIFFYVTVLSTDENWLMANIGLLMEVSVVVPNIRHACGYMGVILTQRTQRSLSYMACCIAVTFRVVIPVTMLVFGLSFAMSPFSMGYASLILFFLCLIFYSVLSIYISAQSCLKCRRTSHFGSLQSLDLEVHNDCSTVETENPRRETGYLKRYENVNVYAKENDKLSNQDSKVPTKEKINFVLGGSKLDNTVVNDIISKFHNNCFKIENLRQIYTDLEPKNSDTMDTRVILNNETAVLHSPVTR